MRQLGVSMAVVLTNWINITGVFVITYLYVITDVLLHSGTFIQAILGGLISVCLYGMMFWGLFSISLVALDILVIMRNRNRLKAKLLLEWLLISSPFIYWTIKYHELIFAVAIVAFFISQLLREKLIRQARRLN
jgi:hypothetical protein